jgi:hypothetical protein
VHETVLELEYDNLVSLQRELNKNLLAVDTYGLRATDYRGFNYKAKILRRWGSSEMKRLLRRYPTVDYVIAYVAGDIDTLEHERRHYYYFKDPEYRKRMDQQFLQPQYAKLLTELRKKGYREKVILDEAQAHYKNYS